MPPTYGEKSGLRIDPAPAAHHIDVHESIDPDLESFLHTDPTRGLSSADAKDRLVKFGRNEIAEVRHSLILKFLSYFTGSIAFLIEVAAVLSAVVEDWLDFGIIVTLLIVNAVIGFVEEVRAESALDALRQTLALKTRVWRDANLVELDTAELVPGDIIVLRLGDIVPADARLLGVGVTGEATDADLQIDQSALTGESLPSSKCSGDTVYSSSVVKQGHMLAVVTGTGARTFVGRAANLIAITTEPGHFQKVVNQIGNFLVLLTVGMVLVIFGVLLASEGRGRILDIVRDMLVLTVAAIPVGLPTVLSVTMAVGAKELARKQVIIKRLTAVEELASVSVLCSDKTGTLTLNELTFDEPYLAPGYSTEDILLYAYMSSEPGANDAIESAVRTAAKARIDFIRDLPQDREHDIPGFKVLAFTPFNPTSKLTQSLVKNLETGEIFRVAKGAPQVIVDLVGGDDDATRAVNALARRGLRALGVARTMPGSQESWEMIGMISLIDPPRPDSAETIRQCEEMGISVKMLTGDQLIIGKEVARRLGMQRCILDTHQLVDPKVPKEEIVRRCEKADGFGHMIPEHKYRVVELLQERGYLVAVTGDGVNDAPALKKANVGIAVHGCTDAARSAADIVLLASGLGTIIDGITTSRAIFQRMRSYALYRITSTIHFLLFFFVIILSEGWYLPALLLVIVCILNDGATLVIAWDHAKISDKPDKWRLGQLISLSFILGALLAGLSFGVFFVARDVFHVTPGELHSIMYLNISSAPHFVIFSTRVQGFFWESAPSWIFVLAVLGTQVFAMVMCIFGLLTPKISVAWGFSVLGVSLVFFIFLDLVKVWVMRSWSFELTARLWPSPNRRRKLAARKKQAAVQARVRHSVAKVRKVVKMCSVLVAMRKVHDERNEKSEIGGVAGVVAGAVAGA